MGGSSFTSNKPIRLFTGTDPEYSVKDCLNAATASFVFKYRPRTIKYTSSSYHSWIHRRPALMQTNLDGAATKMVFSPTYRN